VLVIFFFSSRRRHTRSKREWSSDVCSSDLGRGEEGEHLLRPGAEADARDDEDDADGEPDDERIRILDRIGPPRLPPQHTEGRDREQQAERPDRRTQLPGVVDDEGADDEVDDLVGREPPLPSVVVDTDDLDQERHPDGRTAEDEAESGEPPRALALPEQDQRAEDEDERDVRVEVPQVETGTTGFEDAAHELVADIDGVGVEEVESEDEDDGPAGERNQEADDAVPRLRD